MPEQSTEEITLHSAGSIPGIPGSYGPGRYLIDWTTRTATPIVDEPASAENTTAPTAADIEEE